MKRLFLHNRHDKHSTRLLDECRDAGLRFEVVDVYAGDRANFVGLSPRAVPAYVVVASSGEIIASFDGDNLVPSMIATMEFVEPEPAPLEPEPSLEQRIADLEEALALLHLQLTEVMQR